MSLIINLLSVVTFIGISDQKVAREEISVPSCNFFASERLKDRSKFVRTDVLLGAGFNNVFDFRVAHPLAVRVGIIFRNGEQVKKHFFLDSRLDVVHGLLVQHDDFGLGKLPSIGSVQFV